jgi:carboxypeptidase D
MRPPAVIAALLAVAAAASARIMTKHEVRELQLEAAKRWHTSGPAAAAENVRRSGVQNITFANPKASGE